MDTMGNLAMLILGIGYLVIVIGLFVLGIAGFILRIKHAMQYKKDILMLLKNCEHKDVSYLADAVLDVYKRYLDIKINIFPYNDITSLNGILRTELLTNKYKDYFTIEIDNVEFADKLDSIDKFIVEKSIYSKEKLDELLDGIQAIELNLQSVDTVKEQAKGLFSACLAYCDGTVAEKNNKIYQLEIDLKNAKRKKIITRIVEIISIISAIITIVGAM